MTKKKAARAKRPSHVESKGPDSLVMLILAHGRPDNCPTYSSLRKAGYTGDIRIVLDDGDKTRKGYEDKFGAENIIVFDKEDIMRRYPNGDNFMDKRAVVYARNASFEIAKKLGYRYFMQMDDDYIRFAYRINGEGSFINMAYIRKMDRVLDHLLDFYKSSGALSIAMAQGGDFIGGPKSALLTHGWSLRRKAMNSWLCDTRRPFTFVGRMNEDVSAYVRLGATGSLFFTIPQVMLEQVPTQSVEGGMSGTYAENGTYVKSFYTVMMQPSSVKIAEMGKRRRLHHLIPWKTTVPKILRESVRKPR